MKEYEFKAIMTREEFLCNDCLEGKELDKIPHSFQDTGVCEVCCLIKEISKPEGAKILMDNNVDLETDWMLKDVFFKDIPTYHKKIKKELKKIKTVAIAEMEDGTTQEFYVESDNLIDETK